MRPGLALIAFLTALVAVSPASALDRPTDISNDRWVEVSEHGATQNDINCAYLSRGDVARLNRSAGQVR
jgi:hypothetical protein